MEEKVYITEEFKRELSSLGCYGDDYIVIYKRRDGIVYFKNGKCKLTITEKELEQYVLQSP